MMTSEEENSPQKIDSIKYLDELTGVADSSDESTEPAAEAEPAEPSPRQREETQYREYVGPKRREYNPIPEDARPVPLFERTVRFRDLVLISILTLGIGLVSAGLYAKTKINDLNTQLAQKDEQLVQKEEQIRILEEENARLTEKVESTPNFGDFGEYDYNDWIEMFGGLFGDFGNWFNTPENGQQPPMSGNGSDSQNAVPADTDRAYLGIRVRETDEGVRVTETLPNAKSNVFEADDLIRTVNGTEVKDIAGITDALKEFRQGDTVEVTVSRNGEEQKLEVTLTDRYETPNINIAPGSSQNF